MKKQLLTSLVALLVIIVFNFALPRLMPGDSVLMLTGMDERSVRADEYAYYEEVTGLNRPVHIQFAEYIKGIFTGNLGYSFHHNEYVGKLIAKRIPATLQIAVPSILLSSVISLCMGLIAGMKKGTAPEIFVSSVQLIVDAIPVFMLGMVLVVVFAFKLGILPTGALSSIYAPKNVFEFVLDRIYHLILPVSTLVISMVPGRYIMIMKMTEKEKHSKYVIYAKSRGVSDFNLAFRHILPAIAQPFITMVGMNIGFMFSGSLVIENIFSIKGMGMLLSSAITSRDYPVLQGILFVSALFIVVATIITDIICIIINPKMRHSINEK